MAKRENAGVFRTLKKRWEELKTSANVQERGFAFERWLKGLLVACGFDVHGSFRRKKPDEQIDGAIHLGSDTLLLEAKWLQKPVGGGEVDRLAGRVSRGVAGTAGVFFSASGFSRSAVETADFCRASRLILLVDAAHIESLVNEEFTGSDWLEAFRHLAARKGTVEVSVEDIRKELRDRGAVEKQRESAGEWVSEGWPGVSVFFGGPKVSEPFAGREEELGELRKAMRRKKGIVAVVGMAGRGKSCLVGEWFKRGARPPAGVGLFWRRVYEAGYSFDRFVSDLHVYLTGREINPQAVPSVEGRAASALAALKGRPCWIVLDGMERWLKRWAAAPDAGVENLTVDDRAGQDEVLDKFLKEAGFWENGSRLVLTTRAAPSALDENAPVMIGQAHGNEKRLADLKEDEAVELLKKLGVKGDEKKMREAAKAYGCHAYAVHVLGLLIFERYGGDASLWEEASPFEEKKKGRDVGGLFARVIENREGDRGLIELLACSVGPGPVEMLAKLLGEEDKAVRRRLAELAKWQMVEFGGKTAEEHTVVRQYLLGRMGVEKAREVRKAIAGWWAGREVPVNPTRREDIEPLLKAVEHLLAAGDPDAATDIFLTKPSQESYYAPGEWLWKFGYLDEHNRIIGDAIRVYENVIEKEGRVELRNDLAMCYNNRGSALQVQGKLDEAIEDYGRAIGICEGLVEKEGRLELRNDLAMCYNNRGNALQDQGKLDGAIEDYGRAIGIREELVEKEGRVELRNDLAMCYNNRGNALRGQGKLNDAIEDYDRAIGIREELIEKEGRVELRWNLGGCLFNRAIARRQKKEWKGAREDIERGGTLLRGLIGEGRRHIIESFMKTAGYRCMFAKELGGAKEAAAWANDAMRWFVEEAETAEMNEVLSRQGREFAGTVLGKREELIKGGLDEGVLGRFLEVLKEAGG